MTDLSVINISDVVYLVNPAGAQNVVNRHSKLLLEYVGLPPILWHDLRHTCAILLP